MNTNPNQYDLFNQPGMHRNSLDNWYNEIEPTLTEMENEVMKVIRELGQCSCRTASLKMSVFPHTISGRFTKLKEKNLIVGVGHEKIGNRSHEVFKLNYEV